MGKNNFEKGLIASKNEIASQIGAQVLAKGGNAIDAAIAVGYALGVVEPQGSGLTGGGFALIYLAKTKELKAIDFRERAPESINKFEPSFRDGNRACGIPGCVAGFEYLRSHYGKLPRQTSMEGAIQIAKQGFKLNESLHYGIEKRKDILQTFPSSAEIYLPNGQVPQVGDIFKQTVLANTLELISEKGADEFYKGDLAKKIVLATDNFMSLKDLKNYKVAEYKALCGKYRQKYKICSFPLPSSGGICMIEALNILENFDLSSMNYDDPQRVHYLIEALRFSFADRATKLGDPKFNRIEFQKLLSKKYAQNIAKRIQLSQKAIPSEEVFFKNNTLKGKINMKPETTHYTVADKEGNIVAITISLNGSLGSGFVIPQTGMLLNNSLDDFSLPNAPNQYGLIGNKLNFPKPNKAPLSSMSPSIVFDESNKPVLALGSPGGPTIISAVLNTILAYIDHKMSIEQAVSANRIHHQWQPDHVYLEDKNLQKVLEQKYNHLFPIKENAVWSKFYWSVQAIELDWDKHILKGSSDPRREQGLVFEN